MEELKADLSVERLNVTKLKSDGEREASSHKHETGKLHREVKLLTESVDTLRNQKAELSKDLEVSKVKLAEVQARLTDAQTEIAGHREKEKVNSFPRAVTNLSVFRDIFPTKDFTRCLYAV